MATKKKQNPNSFTVQVREENASLQREIAALKTKVRKLQAENRKLKAELVDTINRHTPDMNAELVATDVDTKGESHADTEEIESVAPINTQGGTN